MQFPSAASYIDEGSPCIPRSLVASTEPSGPAAISDQEYKFRTAARPQHAQHAQHAQYTPSRVLHFRDYHAANDFS